MQSPRHGPYLYSMALRCSYLRKKLKEMLYCHTQFLQRDCPPPQMIETIESITNVFSLQDT